MLPLTPSPLPYQHPHYFANKHHISPNFDHTHTLFLKFDKEATKPAAENFLQQQGKFDHFIEQYNCDRPH